MARPVNTDLDMLSASRLTNLPDPTDAQHAATKAYVDAAVEGINWKDSVRVASTANLNLSSPGSTIDSVSVSLNDRVLVKDQSTQSQNGIYIWNGASSAMTRSPDASTAAELESAVVTVEEGTSNVGTTWRQTTVNFTLGSGNVVWEAFGATVPDATESTAGKLEIATQSETNTGTDDARAVTPLKLASWSGRVRKHSQDFGDGSSTSYAITHNFGSRDVIAQVRLASGTYDIVDCEIEMTDTNTVTVKTVAAPASNAYRITILGG